MQKKRRRKSHAWAPLKVLYTCTRFFCSGFLHWSNICIQTIRLLSVFNFVLEFAHLLKFFHFFGGDSVDTESHFQSTEPAPSETPLRLYQHRVRLHVNGVNAGWWNFRKCWCLLSWLSWRGVSLCIDSVDGESHFASTECAVDESSQNRHT